MFGIESEVAFAALGPGGKRVDQEHAMELLMQSAISRNPHLPGHDCSGVFLQTGGRLYTDCAKPEITTPEVVTPWDLCRYVQAGEQILLAAAQAMAAENAEIQEVILTRCNVSYGSYANTWACHENYSHRVDLYRLQQQLVPFLVSRIVYSGAGGFDNTSQGIVFLLSPRVAHLTQTASSHSQSKRGIFHTKDESLAGSGYRRLHVLCGESVSSETTLWLKVATTALVVALIEAGFAPGDGVQLVQPPQAMKAFAADPSLHRCVTTESGPLTALQVQRHYLQKVEAHLDAATMPDWAAEGCRLWRATLDQLQQGSTEKKLDWSIKFPLYQRFAEQRGFCWRKIDAWNTIVRRISAALRARQLPGRMEEMTAQLLRPGSAIAPEVRRLAPLLREHELELDQLPEFFRLRRDLLELDTRFGQLGPKGIFTSLSESGWLEQHVPGVDDIQRAIQGPPNFGRARLRGQCILEMHRAKRNGSCAWECVWDHHASRYLDLNDPFQEVERWETGAQARPRRRGAAVRMFDVHLRRASEAYFRGAYEDAYHRLHQGSSLTHRCEQRQANEMHRLLAWTQARRGFLDGVDWLARVEYRAPMPLWLIIDYLCVHRFEGLRPRNLMGRWVREGERTMARQRNVPFSSILSFREQQAVYFLHEGRLAEARDALEAFGNTSAQAATSNRIHARAMATLGEVHRRAGDPSRAKDLLETAETVQREQGYLGDLADLTLPALAKLAGPGEAAHNYLRSATEMHRENENCLGHTKDRVLNARLQTGDEDGQSLRQAIEAGRRERPALSACPLLTKILNRWDEWTSGHLAPDDAGDGYWGL